MGRKISRTTFCPHRMPNNVILLIFLLPVQNLTVQPVTIYYMILFSNEVSSFEDLTDFVLAGMLFWYALFLKNSELVFYQTSQGSKT